ncbi:MAG: hypothetical protein PHP95_11940 [Desulfuromonadaceae bacterium]|nr:hypothetical protein [Desulfuromonadaceae bacterium]MDD2849157.1 hypothetical protein [Desulfuromonadaceae bacterium]MDD4129525.1 hypothetical protein [Desulfuromonadaceae bacterium]
MAIPTDDSTEKASVPEEVQDAGNAEITDQLNAGTNEDVTGTDQDVAEAGLPAEDSVPVSEAAVPADGTEHLHDRKEEVMELLGGTETAESEESETVPLQNEEAAATATDHFDALLAAVVDQLPPRQEAPDNGNELKIIMETLQESLSGTHDVSVKIDAISSTTDELKKQINNISNNYEMLTAEMELMSSEAHTKSVLSKTFLIISSLLVTSLVVLQIYMFVSQIKIQQLQNAAGSSVLENVTGLNNKLAEYDKNITRVLEKSAQEEHAGLNQAMAAQPSHEAAATTEVAAVAVTPVLEKLNKLRNGLPEKKLIRKESGDWFVYTKKGDECVSDVDVIEALNDSYIKIGRTLTPTIPMPQHKALCILKPDGKGGTKVDMTKEFVQ